MNGYKVFNGAKYFSLEIFQNYLVFIPAKKYIKYLRSTTRINSWKSNGKSERNFKKQLNQTVILHHLLLIIMYQQT